MRHATTLTAIALAGLAAGGCSKPAPTTPASATSATATPIPTHDIALADYSIQAPSSIPAGYASFTTTNSGKEMHQAALVRIDSGKSVGDFEQAMAKDGPPPAWVSFMGGPQNTATVTMKLDQGNYLWYCIVPGSDGKPHMMKGMVAPMTVTAATGPDAAAPVADIDVTMHDYQWDFSTPLTAGRHTLKITTAAGQPHEFVLVRLADGKSVTDLAQWLHSFSGPPPETLATGIAVMQAGTTNYATVDLAPGHYAVFCMVPDAHDGKDHVTHGMVKDMVLQ